MDIHITLRVLPESEETRKSGFAAASPYKTETFVGQLNFESVSPISSHKVKNCYENQNLLRAIVLVNVVPCLGPSALPSSTQGEVFEQSEVWRSQTSDRIPTLDSREPTRAAPGIVPTNDVVQTFEPFTI